MLYKYETSLNSTEDHPKPIVVFIEILFGYQNIYQNNHFINNDQHLDHSLNNCSLHCHYSDHSKGRVRHDLKQNIRWNCQTN